MKQEIIAVPKIVQAIFLVRGHKVILSQDLAALYGVPVKALNQAVKRHAARFPGDFLFQLTSKEFENLKSQFVTSSWGGLRRALPYAFTEQGVTMLSSVLRSGRAWVAHASRVLVSASRRNNLPSRFFGRADDKESSQWRDAIASERDARATR